MILPVVAYGDPVLRKVAKEIGPDYPNLKELIANMKQTMYNANGVGIAAPQIGKSVRIFITGPAPGTVWVRGAARAHGPSALRAARRVPPF